MLRELSIKNYKSILDNTISLGRINVFIGENGCGKTNILEALAMTGAAQSTNLATEELYNRGIRVARPIITFSSFLNQKSNTEIRIKLKHIDYTSIKSKESNTETILYCENPDDIYAPWVDKNNLTKERTTTKRVHFQTTSIFSSLEKAS